MTDTNPSDKIEEQTDQIYIGILTQSNLKCLSIKTCRFLLWAAVSEALKVKQMLIYPDYIFQMLIFGFEVDRLREYLN